MQYIWHVYTIKQVKYRPRLKEIKYFKELDTHIAPIDIKAKCKGLAHLIWTNKGCVYVGYRYGGCEIEADMVNSSNLS